ncbi:MAG: ABC transporter substrate-binding protein [Geminicoccaceae bacterium]
MWRRQHDSPAFFKSIVGGLVVLALLIGSSRARAAEPRQIVETLNHALLEVMRQADELGYRGRYGRLAPTLEAAYNFPFMTRVAVGRGWSGMSEQERGRLTDLFKQMSIATYAARFDGYGGERFEILGQTEAPRGGVVVESRIVRPGEDPVGLNYVLRRFADGWRIVDVLLDAKFSELARQRAEFAAVLSNGGASDLITALERKIETLAGRG